ncbi:MAG: phosphate signaling complex protein PhoU [Proteobacteria bacterium]|nr:phosphate signaling complex protein PhoU [Pseudomonadota bacterium]MDA0844798.1 phosphate signaling complex protein PhoU [Pseudomonadota bacterium]
MEEQQHISTAFDKDLLALNEMVQALGSLAIAQFETAIDALATQHVKTLDQIISNDAKLDDLEATIHEKALEVIALRSPHAKDLRQVLVALKIATILERTGDYARNIANRTKVIAQASNENIPGVNIGRMGQVAQQMLHDVMRAYDQHDVDLALAVWRRDIEVDHMHTAFYKEVLASMARDPNLVATGAHLLFIAKNIERIGDYATGIAEQVHFLVRGAVPEDSRPKADRTSKVVGV